MKDFGKTSEGVLYVHRIIRSHVEIGERCEGVCDLMWQDRHGVISEH